MFIVGDPGPVYVLGDSIAYWAMQFYDRQPETRSTWPRLEFIGGRGATPRSIKLLLAKGWPQPSPRYAIVHVGTNNIGQLPAYCQRQELESLFEFLPCLSDTTEFIWSDILPKASLGQAGDLSPQRKHLIDKIRKDLNRFGRRLCRRQGGRFIKHPAINLWDTQLFRPDGIHLSAAGCELLVQDWLRGPDLQCGHVDPGLAA